MRASKTVAVFALASAVAGCAVGPNYRAPSTPMPQAYDAGPNSPPGTQPTKPANERTVDLARWWQSLGDRELDSLVERAIRANPDISIALARLQEARAQEYVVNGGTLPLVDFAAGAGRGTGSDSTRSRIPGPLHSGANTSGGYKEITEVAGFDAVWEIDLFGRFQRQNEAARADAQAAYEARNAVLITVIADVARAYVDERALAQRLAVARQNLAIQQQSLDLVTARFNRGITNELDVALARRELATVQSTISPLQSSLVQAQRRVAVLLGEMPQNLYAELNQPATLPFPSEKIQPGLPIELLRRRPDIRQSERQLAAATARIGVATADLFPRVALVGSFGFQGQGIGRTPVMEKEIWSLGPSLYWPLLDFGTLDSVLEFQDLRTRELLFAYRRSVLLAVEEVDNAISNYHAQRDRLDRLNDAVAASERAVQLATQRYDRGLTDFLNVLDAQRQLYGLQDQQVIAQESVVVQYIALYKALGGGWEPFQRVPDIRHPQPTVFASIRETVAPTSQPTGQ